MYYAILAGFLFLLYARHISPEIGMGTSGIITAAITSGGLGPVPNYPVHNLITRAIMFFAPFARADYAANLTSFVMAVAAILLMTRVLVQFTQSTCKVELEPHWTLVAGLAVSFLFFQSPGAARFIYFGDRYTVELFFLALVFNVFLDAGTGRMKFGRAMVYLAFFMSFQFFCHPKSVVLVWALTGILWLWRRGETPPIWKMAIAFLLGMVPVLYLPLVSSTNPLFDWGNPETLRNIYDSLTRKEYDFVSISRDFSQFLGDELRQYTFLRAQVPVYLAVLVATGVYFAVRRSWRTALALFVVLLLAGEFVTTVIHWPFYGRDARSQMSDWYLINYYLPYFGVFFFFGAFGLLVPLISSSRRRGAVAVGAICALAGAHLAFGARNSQADYALSTEVTSNYEALLPEGSLLFTNSDGLFPALLYNQIHKGRIKNRYIVHTEFLFRSWYYNDLERLYPELWRKHQRHFEALRDFFLNFERTGYDEKAFRISTYYFHINAIASAHAEAGVFVYVDPEVQPFRAGLFRSFQWEPEGLLFRLIPGGYLIRDLPTESLRFSSVRREFEKENFWAWRFQSVFARIFNMRLERARMMQSQEASRLEATILELQNAAPPRNEGLER